ncbi:MAG: hypothetical protein JNL08_10820 [Planctomycetes bacterium]|nr:hypothetical protein [Planctomycetota bacterium]
MRALPLFLFAAVLPAQQARWQLPPGGVAVYTADEALEPDPPGGRLPGCPLPHATILFQSELHPSGSHVVADPADWRWIAPHLAFDLRLPGKGPIKARLSRVPGLGNLELTGTAATDAATGVQTFELRFQVQEPVLDTEEKKQRGRDSRPWFGGDGGGSLRLERTVDATAGVVQAFTARFELNLTLGPHHGLGPLKGTFTQSWQLETVRERRGRDFQARVDQAIQDAAEVIEHELQPDRPEFATRHSPTEHTCGEGHLALTIQTLLAAERPRDGPALQAAFAELHRREIRETYSLAVALLATDQAFAPPLERDNLLRGVIERPTPRQLPPEHAAKVAEWSQRLLQNRDQGVDAAYRSRWWYLAGSGFDNSNTQYALFGLFAASLARQDIGRGVWLAAGEHWLSVQHPAIGAARSLELVPLAELDAGKRTSAGRSTKARGFGYTLPGDGPAYGSMTCAGIAGLSLCRGALDLHGKTPLDQKLDAAIREGFAWLAAHRSVRWNPGPPPLRHHHFFYWLYSLDRACELSRVGRIDDWDWYWEGAELLLAIQDHNGRFGEAQLEEQCFALLFLKKAQLPVLTGPR